MHLTYFKKIQNTEKKPDYVIGHSLGEYNALLASGVFDFETGLELVKKRGELMSQATGGAMTAVIGLKVEVIENVLKQNNLINVAIANHNSYTQLVISGQSEDIAHAQTVLEQAGALMVFPLKVSGAFHTSYMRSAQDQFEQFLKNFSYYPPMIPIIANYTALPYIATDIQKNLTQQISQPVRWTETIEYLLTQGKTNFEEVGTGLVLTGLVRRIKNGQ